MAAFAPFRPVGTIMGEMPVDFTLLYEKPAIIAPVAKTFLIYGGLEMNLMRGGPTFECDVTAVAHSSKYRYVAEGGRIHAFSHHKPLWTKTHSELQCPVTRLCAIDELLFSVGSDRKVVVWEYRTGERLNEWALPHDSGSVTAIKIPLGYNNKVLIATSHGMVHLYNFHTKKLLHTFGGGAGANGQAEDVSVDDEVEEQEEEKFPPISCMTVHPHFKDLIAFGTTTGKIFVYHLGDGRTIATFSHREGSSVSAVEFRKDAEGTLFTATSAGEIALWDLHKKSLAGIISKSKQVRSREDVLENAHTDIVHTLISFPSQALLISCSADNSMCQYRLDTVDGMALLVRERRGHAGPSTTARFYNTDLILTASTDRTLRCTHIFSDRASWEMSQGKMGKRARDQQKSREALRLPGVTQIACMVSRNYQWSSIATLHESSSLIAGWRLDTRALEMRVAPLKTGVHCCRCVALSLCGNYAMVGYSSGHLTRVNLQDGTHKHFYNAPPAPAHGGSVEAVEIGSTNDLVISASLDRTVKVWNLLTGEFKCEIPVGLAVSHIVVHPHSALVGAACSDFSLRFFDWTQKTAEPVRKFVGHRAAITAMSLTPDTSRHLVSASIDCGVLVWDLATAQCVGQYRMMSPATSLSFHPDALFMLTTNSGQRGAFLWTNNLRYGFVPDIVDVENTPLEKAPRLHFPQHTVEEEQEEEKGVGASKPTAEGQGEGDDYTLFDPSKDIALQSREAEAKRKAELEAIDCQGLSRSDKRFQELQAISFLDQIKERNQPLLPPKKEKAPFFLETTKELNPTFIVKVGDGADAGRKTESSFFHGTTVSPFMSTLVKGTWEEGMGLLAKMTPQQIDLELRSLVAGGDDIEQTAEEEAEDEKRLMAMLEFLAAMLESMGNTDIVQHVLGHFVDLHANNILRFGQRNEALTEGMAKVLERQTELRQRVSGLVDYPLCLASTFSNAFA